MILHIGICEDNLIHRTILINHIEEVLKLEKVSFKLYEFKSGEELLEKYTRSLDILFLDIHMEKLTGMDTARKIREFDKRVEILFTTSISDYVHEGYEVRAYRYLIKPIIYEVVQKHLKECIFNIIEKETNFLIINGKSNLIKINLDSVLYIETKERDLIIHEIDKSYKVKMSMRKIEKLLEGKHFFRCHNSFLVNLKMIESLDKNIVYINKASIPVSKYRVKGLKKELTSLLGAIVC
ncbi:LytTR family DNA-binding domain-containing protein [Romboutsia sp.]|uniref:LytR/AlgR family response regulator transcription factor n=1 Tax=Romboutsia sp. TaxID=1965302 RepID=UPI002CBED5A1|nr:LytTR family DNA-binding domain-containing protein [Romboutsia sp.]HSQ87259.1 LytTR family DNA-binding domain-containing protein [Romboutsia sp.]